MRVTVNYSLRYDVQHFLLYRMAQDIPSELRHCTEIITNGGLANTGRMRDLLPCDVGISMFNREA
jgi:hypothetical protein